ncbi:hypothetical protein NA57DRAFT_70939 [Rhizodiscina lignyota]|uniref:Uncharacterized protein n=1 Tax=Rhizodiscina lignyota TaxID=1504668 RepID=A0A9P4IUL4_9PEZI|nr:hypothetical protein NA57DRAFT_70939 [Rhizodiscina lignyota]
MATHKIIHPILFLALSVSATVIQPRDLTIAENFVLADCGIGTLPDPSASTSREVIYYPGDVWNKDGSTNRPTMMKNVPWDGSYPWRESGVTVTMPNGDEFTATVTNAVHDPQWAGGAYHSYDGMGFNCWSFHKERLYQLDDGKWCSSAFVCNHGSAPDGPVQPSPGPAPAPQPHETVETTFSVNSDMVRIYDNNHHAILGMVDRVTQDGRNCDETGMDVGSGCRISFECHGAGKASVGNMADALKNQVANSKDFATYETDTTQICAVYDTRPGHEGECRSYKDKIDTYVTMSRKISLAIDNIPGEGSSDNPSMQALMQYEITCEKGTSMSCLACKMIAAGMSAIAADSFLWAGPGATMNAVCNFACT